MCRTQRAHALKESQLEPGLGVKVHGQSKQRNENQV